MFFSNVVVMGAAGSTGAGPTVPPQKDVVYLYSDPGNSVCQWEFTPVAGTTDTYNIGNVAYKTKSLAYLVKTTDANTGSGPKVFFGNDPKLQMCQWILKPVKAGENLYTVQNVFSKTKGTASYISTDGSTQYPTLLDDPNDIKTHWHLNLA